MSGLILDHKHLIIRAVVENPPKDIASFKSWMIALVEFIDMELMAEPLVVRSEMEGNKGITGLAVITTSHIAIHSWDEEDPAIMQIDVYSCKEFDPQKIVSKIVSDFNATRIDAVYVDRNKALVEIPVSLNYTP